MGPANELLNQMPETGRYRMEADKDAMLYARVAWAEVKPGKIDDAMSRWKENLTAQQTEAGFSNAYLLLDQTARNVLAISLWTNRAQVEETAAEEGRLKQLGAFLTAPPEVEADRVPVRTVEVQSSQFARVTSADIKGHSVIQSGVIWEEALPEYRRVHGFQGALMLQAIHSARGIVVTFWESEEAARRTSESGMRTEVLSRFVQVMAGPPAVEGFEVVLQI